MLLDLLKLLKRGLVHLHRLLRVLRVLLESHPVLMRLETLLLSRELWSLHLRDRVHRLWRMTLHSLSRVTLMLREHRLLALMKVGELLKMGRAESMGRDWRAGR